MNRADGQDCIRMDIAHVGAGADLVGDVVWAQMFEIKGGLLGGVGWADEKASAVAQLVGHYLEMDPGVFVKTICSTEAQFARAALVGAGVEGELIAVVILPDSKSDADLLEIVDATDSLGFRFGFGQGRQQHGGQDGRNEEKAKKTGTNHERNSPPGHPGGGRPRGEHGLGRREGWRR